MSKTGERAIEILRELGARPAVPFHEQGPARYIESVLEGLDVDLRRDKYGNIIAHYRRGQDPDRRPVAFVAHMDHPGFEIVEVDGDRIVARALGGVPVASLKRPTPVLALVPDSEPVSAEVTPYGGPPPENTRERLVLIRPSSPTELSPATPVVFDLPNFELDGGVIRMRALDDLAGCAGILAALERLVAEGAETGLYAVFTRAEEVGLFGARLVASEETLPRETFVVSVESSSVIPGVAQGNGPVIRTGDASYTFDAQAEQVLRAAAARLKDRDGDFKSQRQLMSGGTCEATAFAGFGYQTTGIAFPLGNYHNATTRIPDPDGGVGAEYIELSDFLGGVDLIAEAARGGATGQETAPGPWTLGQIPDEARARLESTGHR